MTHHVQPVWTTRELNLVIIGAPDGALELLRHLDRLRAPGTEPVMLVSADPILVVATEGTALCGCCPAPNTCGWSWVKLAGLLAGVGRSCLVDQWSRCW